GAVLVVGSDRKSVDAVVAGIATTGKPVEAVALDDTHEDALAMSDRGLRLGARLAHAASFQSRERLPAHQLFLGLECGHSDATSGLVANPLIGRVADLLIDAGGSAVFGETMEWLGAEHVLAKRAATPEVAAAVVAAVTRREARAAASGIDL